MMMKRGRKIHAAVAVAGTFLATAALAADVSTPSAVALATDNGKPATTQAAGISPAAVPNTSASARRVFRDPETGQLRAPTSEELQAILESERAMRAQRGEKEPVPGVPLQLRRYPNGMRSAVLGPNFLVSLKAERSADGTLTITHDRPGYEHAPATTQRPTE